MLDILDFHAAEKMKLGDVTIKTRERLVDFHHRLFREFGCRIEIVENSGWFHRFGNAAKYYPPLLLHFIAHGVWFENTEAFDDDLQGIAFLKEIWEPPMRRIEQRYGVKPMTVRMYPKPDEQTPEEDFYWWSYPPAINDYLIKFAKENNLPTRKWKPGK